jgi:hypothetical protein
LRFVFKGLKMHLCHAATRLTEVKDIKKKASSLSIARF